VVLDAVAVVPVVVVVVPLAVVVVPLAVVVVPLVVVVVPLVVVVVPLVVVVVPLAVVVAKSVESSRVLAMETPSVLAALEDIGEAAFTSTLPLATAPLALVTSTSTSVGVVELVALLLTENVPLADRLNPPSPEVEGCTALSVQFRTAPPAKAVPVTSGFKSREATSTVEEVEPAVLERSANRYAPNSSDVSVILP
jgi:hypothetical protein